MNKKYISCLAAVGTLMLTATNGFSFNGIGNEVNTACAPAAPYTGDCALCHLSDRGASTPAKEAAFAGGTTLTDFFCLPAPPTPTCTDNDNDTYAVEGGACGPVDCNDANAAINPAATDIPNNGVDENCDGSDSIDGSLLDSDGDGFTPSTGDCNDANSAINPSAFDIPNNGIDENCDGADSVDTTLIDNDGDGYTPNTGDCNDANSAINPGATDIPNNGIDENCDGIDTVAPTVDNLLINFPGQGLYTYNLTSKFTRIQTAQAPMSVTADIDSDGSDEVVAFIEGSGLYVWDNGVWGPQLSPNRPESMIKYGNGVAIDFGASGGLYTASATTITKIISTDAALMTAADIDSDGTVELVAYFAGRGIFYYDNGAWTRISALVPEDMIKLGNGLAIDLGVGRGLFTYNTTDKFKRLTKLDPSHITEADVDADGTMELVAYFTGKGIQIRDNGSWKRISALVPEEMIKLDNGLAIDFGAGRGLFTYNTTDKFKRATKLDPDFITEADVDADGTMELVANFPGKGIQIWNNGTWQRVTSLVPDMITSTKTIIQ